MFSFFLCNGNGGRSTTGGRLLARPSGGEPVFELLLRRLLDVGGRKEISKHRRHSGARPHFVVYPAVFHLLPVLLRSGVDRAERRGQRDRGGVEKQRSAGVFGASFGALRLDHSVLGGAKHGGVRWTVSFIVHVGGTRLWHLEY